MQAWFLIGFLVSGGLVDPGGQHQLMLDTIVGGLRDYGTQAACEDAARSFTVAKRANRDVGKDGRRVAMICVPGFIQPK